MTSPRPPYWWPGWCKKIVFVTPRYPEVSGGARYVENFGRALSSIGVNFEIYSIYPGTGDPLHPSKTVIKRENLHRYPVLRQGARRVSNLRKIIALPTIAFKRFDRAAIRRRIGRALRQDSNQVAVIFTDATAKRAFDDLKITDQLRSTLIGQHHSSFQNLEIDTSIAAAVHNAFNAVDAFTALSQVDADKFTALLNVPCIAVPNMLTPHIFVSKSTQAIDRAIVVALGRLSSEKQFDVLIRAFIRATHTDGLRHWRLEIYGEGDQRRALASVIDELNAHDRVLLGGV
ncbi:MAG: hypothetical protein ABWX92_00385, partial [Mycetocola sp.]